MATSKINPALSDFKGSVDGWTYRRTPEGKLCIYAHKSTEKAPSKKQLSQRDRFWHAQLYSRHVLEDPLRRAIYQRLAKARKRPTNNLLVANYLTPPELSAVQLDDYTGQVGQRIRIVAFDEIAVDSVRVEIRGADGAPLEAGAAVEEHGVWCYRTTAALPAGSAWLVVVTVKNRPGHAVIGSFPDPRNATAGGPVFRIEPPSGVWVDKIRPAGALDRQPQQWRRHKRSYYAAQDS